MNKNEPPKVLFQHNIYFKKIKVIFLLLCPKYTKTNVIWKENLLGKKNRLLKIRINIFICINSDDLFIHEYKKNKSEKLVLDLVLIKFK